MRIGNRIGIDGSDGIMCLGEVKLHAIITSHLKAMLLMTWFMKRKILSAREYCFMNFRGAAISSRVAF